MSDKVITQKCGFLDMIEGGDLILADRGFNIADELLIRGAKLEIPAFTKKLPSACILVMISPFVVQQAKSQYGFFQMAICPCT